MLPCTPFAARRSGGIFVEKLYTEQGVSALERIIMQQTGHHDVATLRRYIRMGQIFRQNAASKLGI